LEEPRIRRPKVTPPNSAVAIGAVSSHTQTSALKARGNLSMQPIGYLEANMTVASVVGQRTGLYLAWCGSWIGCVNMVPVELVPGRHGAGVTHPLG
jgi:hypothetical protein